MLNTFDLIPSLTPYPMSSWNTPSLSWTLTMAETPTKYLPWKCHAIKNNDLDRPTHLTVVHKVDGLLRDWVAPAVVTEYLICQTDRPVTLEVSCMLASPNWPLKISFYKCAQGSTKSGLTLLMKFGPSLACNALCIAACSSLEYWSRPNLTNWSDGWGLSEFPDMVIHRIKTFALQHKECIMYDWFFNESLKRSFAYIKTFLPQLILNFSK